MLFYLLLIVIFCILDTLKANHQNIELQSRLKYNGEIVFPFYPDECFAILKDFAQDASNFTLCTILNSRPYNPHINLCEKCVGNYVNFRKKYNNLLTTVVNGTSCGSIISHDRLNAVQHYHDNILNVWNTGNCNDCFDWTEAKPSLKNDTIHFYKMYNNTMNCISSNKGHNSSEICSTCMQSYEQLDEFYKTLSADSIGVDSVCMDIVDSMNATRSIWSKNLNCCNLRRTPEIVFLSCAGIISFLPLLFYVTVRYCGPIQDLPNVLKQSRFKQTILRALSTESRSD